LQAQPESGDLDVVLSMAVIVQGKFRDLIEIRNEVRNKILAKNGHFIHGTISSVPLYITKERPKKLGELEPIGGEKNG
jgi:hypothetical protein